MSNNTATAKSLASIVWLAHRDEALSAGAVQAALAARTEVLRVDAEHHAAAFARSSEGWDLLASLVAETRGHSL